MQGVGRGFRNARYRTKEERSGNVIEPKRKEDHDYEYGNQVPCDDDDDDDEESPQDDDLEEQERLYHEEMRTYFNFQEEKKKKKLRDEFMKMMRKKQRMLRDNKNLRFRELYKPPEAAAIFSVLFVVTIVTLVLTKSWPFY
jgi:hypothetical protein